MCFADTVVLPAQMYQQKYCMIRKKECQEKEKTKMSLLTKRLIILVVIIIIAAVLGRLAVRAVLNLLLGGTMFGGNFL